jgi:hypothetical protein
MSLAPGEYRVGVRAMPFGYYIKSIEYGGQQLAGQTLKVTEPSSPLKLVLTREPPASAPAGVRIQGRVAGVDFTSPSNAVLQLTTTVAPVTTDSLPEQRIGEVLVSPDGSFEIAGVPPGSYTLNLFQMNGPATRVMPATLSVERDLTGLELRAQPGLTPGAQTAASLTASIHVVDANGMPVSIRPTQIGVQYTSDTGSGNRTVGHPNGVSSDLIFQVGRPGIYSISVIALSPGFSVKSITKGDTDISKSGIAVDGTASSIALRITLEYKP